MTDQGEVPSRIAWGMTGAGHDLASCVELVCTLEQADIFLSRAAQEVLAAYRLFGRLKGTKHQLFFDDHASSRPVTRLYTGRYDLVVIAPVTANTIAKMAHGIADNLITNLFAHAGKCQIPTILLPCDGANELTSLTPQGEEVFIHVRQIDRENLARLAGWSGVRIVGDPAQLGDAIKHRSRW
ncbi:flavoprotein [Candidatus Formimonas warabiya]|uniref:Flavoprotein domain-containing protein n=1 Tax=Formimonas warabiya TaxID=1761012 RepID=A0A3G1L1H5_FORW1|nr:flavoprotein [Candidatus Formimonas warabiya]ATW28335.1 hypothetical protein DCMF_03865 [Candidatus Formimonas warabiya]